MVVKRSHQSADKMGKRPNCQVTHAARGVKRRRLGREERKKEQVEEEEEQGEEEEEDEEKEDEGEG